MHLESSSIAHSRIVQFCPSWTVHLLMRALLGDLRSVCLGIGSGTPVSNLTPQKTIPNFANRVTGSDATQHNT